MFDDEHIEHRRRLGIAVIGLIFAALATSGGSPLHAFVLTLLLLTLLSLGPFFTIVIILLRTGVKIGNMTLLTVRGRKSGQPRTTPVWVTEQHGQRWVVSPFGQVNWVRNLRAADEATLTRGRHTERISAAELSDREAASMLKQTLAEAPSFLLTYFDVTPDAPLEEFEREVPRNPVFLLKRVSEQ